MIHDAYYNCWSEPCCISRNEVVHRIEDLESGQRHEAFGIEFETLPDLGRLLSTFASVNDVHFGETECGVVSDKDVGPTYAAADDEDPYPEVMNAGAIAEISAINPDTVMVKGDRLYHIRENHEAYHTLVIETRTRIKIDLPGVTLVMMNTVRPGLTGGTVYEDELEWLADLSVTATEPVLVFGHHQIWDPATSYRSADYFGIQPDESEKLIDLVAKRPAIKGYFSGHTHRNRVRYFAQSFDTPWVEVACVKDFPGMWAEYRVFDGGILQINHRISTEAALAWSDKTRTCITAHISTMPLVNCLTDVLWFVVLNEIKYCHCKTGQLN